MPSREEVFRRALRDRVHFPAERWREFAALSKAEVRAALDNTRQVRTHLERLGLRAARHRRAISLDLALFSCDHGWRSIAGGLNRLAARADQRHARMLILVLEGYLAYLGSRIEHLEHLLGGRREREVGPGAKRDKTLVPGVVAGASEDFSAQASGFG